MWAPIVIFAYNRPDKLVRLVDTLKQNPEFGASPLYIFVDGSKNEDERDRVTAVVDLARKTCLGHPGGGQTIAAERNQGLSQAVIAGVSAVLAKHESAIILEDDLVCTSGFLSFMNQGLNQYATDERIIAVCGYGLKIKRPKDYSADVYLSLRASSWGWATWRDRWQTIDWTVTDWTQFRTDRAAQKAFNRGGSDMTSMLRGYMEGRNNSWAIRFCYNQFRQGKYSVHPFRSYVDNEGFGLDATNCHQRHSRFKVLKATDYQVITPPPPPRGGGRGGGEKGRGRG